MKIGGEVKCTLTTDGTLTINTEELTDAVIDASGSNTDYVIPWNDYRSQVKSVIIKGHISFKEGSSLNHLFYDFYNCESFDGLENLDVSEVVNMINVFCMSMKYNKNLKTLNISGWNVVKVTNMNRMFDYCSCLTSLDLSNWNTTNVTDISNMFYGCNMLKELDLNSLV